VVGGPPVQDPIAPDRPGLPVPGGIDHGATGRRLPVSDGTARRDPTRDGRSTGALLGLDPSTPRADRGRTARATTARGRTGRATIDRGGTGQVRVGRGRTARAPTDSGGIARQARVRTVRVRPVRALEVQDHPLAADRIAIAPVDPADRFDRRCRHRKSSGPTRS
jgi:hypothetical protein